MPPENDIIAELDLAISMVSELAEELTNDPAHKAAEAELLDCMNTPHDDGYGALKTFSSLDDILQHYTEPVYTKMEEGGVCNAQADTMFDTVESLSKSKLAELRSANPQYDALLATEYGKAFFEDVGDRNVILLYAKLSAADPVQTTTSIAAAPSSTPTPVPKSAVPSVIIGTTAFAAEIADTPELRSKGLGERDSLAEQSGMLFVFPDGQASSFWMKGMRFSLDFVWISADCTVVELTEDVQHSPPNTPSSELDIFQSSSPAAYTFEINAGEISRFGIEIGDKVSFHGIQSEFAKCCETGVCGGN